MKTLVDRNKLVKYPYSKSSLSKLVGVHEDMQEFAFEMANIMDIRIVYGVRTLEEQMSLYEEGKSTFDGISKRSSHQVRSDTKGRALDMLPLPQGINMYLDDGSEDNIRWAQFDGACHAIAYKLGIKVKTGFKWRSDMMSSLGRAERDNTFPDGNHVELVEVI